MAEVLRQGMSLSLLIPILAAFVPLAMVAVGIFVYEETTSLARLVLIFVACISVGFASVIK